MHSCVRRSLLATSAAAAALLAGPTGSVAQTPSFLPTLLTIAGNGTAGFSGDGGLATSAEISSTVTTATMDPAGNVYITDTKNNVIRKINPAGIISTFAGSSAGTAGFSGDGGPATSALFSGPESVRYYQGGLYVTDNANNRIRRIDLTTLTVKTVAGGGSLPLNNGSPTNPATSIAIPGPQDIAFDSLGNMYWNQAGGTSRVDVVNLTTGMASIFAGNGGTTGATGVEVSPAGSGRTSPENTALNGLYGLAVDAQNNVYIAEYTTRVIRKVTVGTTPTITTYAGLGELTAGGAYNTAVCAQATNSLGDGCPGPQAVFGTIQHISIDGAGNLYVADSTNNRIRIVPPNPSNPAVGGIVYTYTGNGTAADSPDGTYVSAATISNPTDAQILPSGDLLIIDRASALVRLVHRPGTFVSTTVASPSSAPTQTFNVLTQAGTGVFSLPGATDFTSGGTSTCTAGVGVTGTVCSYQVTFSPTLAGTRTTPLVFTDANGTTVAGLSGTGLAPVASLLPGLTGTAAGTGTAGATGDGGPALAATFQSPGAMATDSFGNIYVADGPANEVRRFAPNGTVTRIAGTGTSGSSGDGAAAVAATLNNPSGVAVDAAGNVYIADTGNNKIREVFAANGSIGTIAGTGAAGYSGDQSTPVTATLNAPTQLAWSPLGVLYVADTGNSVVRAIAPSEQLITTVAGNGTASYDGDGGPGQAAELSSPGGVALDGNNNLYIADTGNNRVRELSQGLISTLAGETGAGFNGDGPAATATLSTPGGVSADPAGNVYIADTGNQRIRLISSGQIVTVMGTGTAGATGDGGSSVLATTSSPHALAVAPGGAIYIADTGNHKIRSIAVNSNSFVFPVTNPTYSSNPQAVSVFSSGNQGLSITNVTFPTTGFNEQSGTSNDCTAANTTPLTLTPGTSCNLAIVFSPPAAGPYTGTVAVGDNSESSTGTQNIQVQGTSAYVFVASLTLPSTGTAGIALAGTLTVQNPLTTYMRTMAFSSTDPQAVLPPSHLFTAADKGMLAFSVTFKTAGPQCLTATDTIDPTVTATVCTKIVAGAAAKIAISTGNNQSANVSTAYTQRLVALATDAYGNTVGGAPVTFTIIPNGTATGTFSNGSQTYSATADPTGYATALVITSGATIGTFTVIAAIPSTAATTTFNLTIVVLGSFTLAPTYAQVGPVAPGASFNQNLIVTPTGGFTAPITFTCKAPAGITCTAGPNPFSVATQAALQAQVIFTSQGSLLGTGSGFTWPWSALTAVLAGGFLLRRRRKLLGVILAATLALALGALSGCGEYYAPQTPDGNYTVTVTGTAQTVSASTNITYTVKF